MIELNEESDDDELAYGMNEKDPEALRLVLRKYGGELNGWLIDRYGKVLHLEERDHIVTEASFKLWDIAERYDSKKGTLGAFLMVITQSMAKDYIKSRGRYRRRHGQADEFFDPADPCSASADPPLSREELAETNKLAHFIETVLVGNQRKIIMADLGSGDGQADNEWLAEWLETTAESIRVSRVKAIANIKKHKQELESLAERYRGK